MPTLELNDFSGGMDLRPGMFSKGRRNQFRLLKNGYVTSERKARRRNGVRKDANPITPGNLKYGCFGLFPINGALRSLMLRGAGITSLPVDITPLYFDSPPNALKHELVEINFLGDVAVVIMKHYFTPTDDSWRYYLHVFDDMPDQLTYVVDPSFPWTHEINPTARPAMTVVASKVWIAKPDGNVGHSATNKARVWNELTRADFMANGYEVHGYSEPLAGVWSVIVPIDRLKVSQWMSGYISYVCEKYIGTGTPDYTDDSKWTRLTESAVYPTVLDTFYLQPGIANHSTGATFAEWLVVNAKTAPGTFFRVRVLPPLGAGTDQIHNYVVSGIINPDQKASVQVYLKGDGATKQFVVREMGWVPYGTTDYFVFLDGVGQARPGAYDIVQVGNNVQFNFVAAPPNGSQILLTQNLYKFPVIVVPPGTINTVSGAKNWAGAYITVANTVGYHYILIALDTNNNPTGLAEISPAQVFTGFVQHTNVVVIKYQHTGFGEAQIIPVYNGQVYPNPALYDPVSYVYRDTVADGTLAGAVGKWFGADNAGEIPTAADDASGGPVTMLGSCDSRLLVMYARGALLWEVFTDPAKDRQLDAGPVGTDGQLTPHGVTFFKSIMVPTARGIRAVSVYGQLKASLDDDAISSPVDPLGFPQVLTAVFWPYISHYIAAVQINGVFMLLVLSYEKDSKVIAWSQFALAGIASIDYRSFVPLGSKLYFRSGDRLYYFDGASSSFRDDNDTVGAGNAFQTEMRWHRYNCDRPGSGKKFLTMNTVQTGKCTWSFLVLSDGVETEVAGPILEYTSIESATVGLAMHGQAIAPKLVTTDETGFELEALNIEFTYKKR